MQPPTAAARPRATGSTGLRVVSFESRRADDVAKLIQKSGATAILAPSMREIPLSSERGALDFGRRLMAGECDGLVLLTGVGTTILVDALCTEWPRSEVLARLGETPLLCRGPKPVAVLKGLGLKPSVVAPSPNTHRELVRAIRADRDWTTKRVFVQEYGSRNDDLMNALDGLGAITAAVRVYRWALPEDQAPLERALQSIAARDVDAVIFTSAHQVQNVLCCCRRLQIEDSVRRSLADAVVVASVGPVTSEALSESGIAVDLCPETPKMGPLVITVLRRARELAAAKRSRSAAPDDLPAPGQNG